jgi:hypothetical protein
LGGIYVSFPPSETLDVHQTIGVESVKASDVYCRSPERSSSAKAEQLPETLNQDLRQGWMFSSGSRTRIGRCSAVDYENTWNLASRRNAQRTGQKEMLADQRLSLDDLSAASPTTPAEELRLPPPGRAGSSTL